jgi:hypothetical protein
VDAVSILRWIILLASVVFYRVWFPDGPPPLGLRLDYEMLAIALVALYRGVTIGAAAGWGIGFLAQAADPDMMGWGGLLGASLGWAVGLLKERLFLEYVLSRWLVFWGVLLLIKTVYVVFAVGMDPGMWLASFFPACLGSAGLSATVGVILSVLWDRARPRARAAAEASSDGDPLM